MNAPTDLKALAERGNTLAHEGKFDDADAVFSQLLDADPDNLAALHFKAYDALRQQRFEDAERVLNHALAAHPGDAITQFNLALALYGLKRPDEARAAIEGSLAANPEQPWAWLYHGAMLEQGDRHPEAIISFLRGLTSARRMGAAPTEPEMRRLAEHAAFVVSFELDRHITEALTAFGEVPRIRAGADAFVGKSPAQPESPLQRPGLFFIPGLAARPFHATADFDWAPAIAAARDAIAAETAAETEVHYYRSGELTDAAERHPRTVAALETADLHRVPGYGPQAALMSLAVGARVARRYGPTNARLVAQLPLSVPASGAGLRVGDETHAWVAGELVIFDDTFAHEFWNDGDAPVSLLTFDVWNPQLTATERDAFTAVLTTARQFERSADLT